LAKTHPKTSLIRHDAVADILVTRHSSEMLNRLNLLAALVVLGGCSATDVTQTSWTASPTGDWQSRIERSETAGPGAGYLAETVQVKQRSGDKSVDVFTLEEMNGSGKIELRWQDPNHLQVAYANGSVIFQAAKVGNLTIQAVPLAAH
jgi:hypothetical protein